VTATTFRLSPLHKNRTSGAEQDRTVAFRFVLFRTARGSRHGIRKSEGERERANEVRGRTRAEAATASGACAALRCAVLCFRVRLRGE